jgi:hypothetical protein
MSDVYEGRNAEILRATIDGSPYDREPESVIEYLLLELKKVIEEGGGGGGTTNYNALSNKPQINDVELSGNKSLDDLGIQSELTFDSTPTENSTNPVTSGGVYTALAGKQDTLTIDSALSDTSENPVQNKVIYSQIYEQLYTTLADIPNNAKGSMELYSKDLNNITTSGFYNAMTCTNAPFNYMTLIVTGYYLSGYCTQIACDVTTGNYMFRTQTGGTWGAWTDNVFGTFSTKQDKTLTTPVVVEGTSQTTVEGALGAINTSADKRLIATDTMPTASADLVGKQRLYVGATTATYTKGVTYECQLVPESDPAEYEWIAISQEPLTFDSAPTASSTNPVTSGGVYTALAGKQDTLTNPLTQSDVKDNLISTDTNKPLSANQGKVLQGNIDSVLALISGVENGATASKTYYKGDYILRNGDFYVVTDTIATGGTITVGVNISETTIGEELTQIKSDLTISTTTNVNYTGSVATNMQSLSISKFNNLVVITFCCSSTATTTNAWLKLFQINALDFRPTHEISFSFVDTTFCKPMAGRVKTDGTVECVQQTATGFDAARIQIIYMI